MLIRWPGWSVSSSAPSHADVTRAFKARMARIACAHLSAVDPRTATILQATGIVKAKPHEGLPETAKAVLLDPMHPLRVKCSTGPLLFHKEAADEGKQYATAVATFLFDFAANVRAAALDALTKLRESAQITSSTGRRMAELRQQLLAEDTTVWQHAAVAIYDASRDDILCQLAGLKQSLEQRFDQGLGEYLGLLLKPSAERLQELEL